MRRDFTSLAAPALLVAAIGVAALGGGAERLQSLAQLAEGPIASDVPSLSEQADSESAAMVSWLAGTPLGSERTAPGAGGGADRAGPAGEDPAGVTMASAGGPGAPGVGSAPGDGGGTTPADGGASGGGAGPVQGALDQARTGVDQAVRGARDAVGRTRDAVAGAGRKVRDRTENVRDRVGSAVDEVGDRVRRGARNGPGIDLPGLP
jgi:hypothetical protein